ncbi:MAG: ATP-binding protein [Myxococcota bacterium]
MTRFFNTAGPCVAADHYMLPPLSRLPDLRLFIERKQYFVIHAPRQTGKTTALQALARGLADEGRYAAAYVSAEVGGVYSGVSELGAAEAALLGAWTIGSRTLSQALRPPPWPSAEPGQRILAGLSAWAEHCPRPLVMLIDEIDALRDDVLISVLRQLRTGYSLRPDLFPWSIALVGLRDVRDYLVGEGEPRRQGTASPFNIKVRSLTLTNFTADDVAELYAQHHEQTGQAFEGAAVARAFQWSGGQPWLVNALAGEIIDHLRPDRAETITADDMDRAARILIERQDTHLDSLAARLREPRIRAVLEPMLAGESMEALAEDDRRFVLDLGLVRRVDGGGLQVANPIYREVIVRMLASGPQDSLPELSPTWLDGEGQLDSEALRDAFLAFWRQHGDALQASAPYHEVAAQLVLMAFLHRVVNGGGWIEREYAIGRGRIDLCLRLGNVTIAMELKVWRGKQRDPLASGLEQLDRYLDGLGLDTGWLVIFDQREQAGLTAERTRWERVDSPKGREITLVRA